MPTVKRHRRLRTGGGLTSQPNPSPDPDPLKMPSKRVASPSSLDNSAFRIRLSRDASPQPVSETMPVRAGCFSFASSSFSSNSSSFCRPGRSFRAVTVDPVVPVANDSAAAESAANVSGVSTKRAPVSHPNSISNVCSAGMAPFPRSTVKRGGDGGNFVKLNLDRGKKFPGRRSKFRKFRKRRFRKGNDGEDDAGLVGSEEEGDLQANEEERRSLDGDSELWKAVAAAREDHSDENLRNLLKLTHGFDSFRDGQLEAIKRVLANESMMLVLPTGSGKSLCYQLPALIFPGIVLVVSPLVSLMIDQLRQLPPMIPGSLLCSTQTSKEAAETIENIRSGAIKVLFVSPERLLNAEFLSIFACESLVSFVVIDEAHCLSEWSHNFRPSYMRLRASVLCDKLNVKCFLAMTATATLKTLNSIMSVLEIPPTNLIQASCIRKNLQLSVISSKNRKYETDLVCKLLSDNQISARIYHSGIPAKDRILVQKLFCSNKIQVVVATVAFGMGLNKSDVGAVIHYSLPGSIEEYVQEIGRAGRDGCLAFCHILLDDSTYLKLRSLAYSDGVDDYAVNKFLCHIFDDGSHHLNKVHSLIVETLSRKLDMKEEVLFNFNSINCFFSVMDTILTYLEIGEVKYLQLFPQMHTTCNLRFHKTAPSLLAVKDVVVANILKGETKQGYYVFDIPTLANTVGMTPHQLVHHIQRLKSMEEVTYELKDLAFFFVVIKFPEDLCTLVAHITRRLSEVENYKIWKLDAMYSLASSALERCKKVDELDDSLHMHYLQQKIVQYFGNHGDNENFLMSRITKSSPYLRADIKVFLQANSHTKFTPRAVARILHGISSPNYPASIWSKTHFWGRYSEVDFLAVKETAAAELISEAIQYGEAVQSIPSGYRLESTSLPCLPANN
ncbi:ATP-dependent DNA helicase Q-like 5 [Nymphaea thermarum]|nr:ATP-dependent DNA helicase Q-like 5 [Nymphaea thermarum]